jgi:hypothetical protein
MACATNTKHFAWLTTTTSALQWSRACDARGFFILLSAAYAGSSSCAASMRGILELSLQVLNAFNPARYGTSCIDISSSLDITRDILIHPHVESVLTNQKGITMARLPFMQGKNTSSVSLADMASSVLTIIQQHQQQNHRVYQTTS